ncbi:2,3-diaminopropionate biosynthesis protein SbnA [Rhizobium rhizogenes]|uniref:2,3-diaminopropionate biosynthesis protein SbnA n=1 Tax=Rhizobium rhizogenes TaxID=359 RepID=UPI00157193B9|nr:2,3-diaminopropionate biosynthesis protein SbnA [Rhizobium rhizogenes]NTG02971.1 2,3-diaminopropionate biosynthesis protein SbnA [Rhizobium rhizogenes]NTG10034.1 2,3-diaminopropionate biosynthesis protein SbnA [Rhizobium rhizogenes]
MRVTSPLDLLLGDIFLTLSGVLPQAPVHLKLEGFNMAGSIKLKPAIHMIEELERQGILKPGKKVIESSSGNLGVALSLVCRAKGYPFVCVSDPNLTSDNKQLIEAYGGEVIIADERDPNHGYLQSRLSLIARRIEQDPALVWTNQYANADNKGAHSRWTGPEILREFPDLDVLVIGAGTTGTLMGCAEYVRQAAPNVRIFAVDAEGSVTFGHPAGKRFIPGLGTSRRPELADPTLVDDILLIPEAETVSMCHWLLDKHQWLLGGSTGTVLAGVRRLAPLLRPSETVVAISPDMGERYLDTVYNEEWLSRHHLSALPDSNSVFFPSVQGASA